MRFIFTTDGHLSSKRPVARVEKTDEEYIDNQLVKEGRCLSMQRTTESKQLLMEAISSNIGKWKIPIICW